MSAPYIAYIYVTLPVIHKNYWSVLISDKNPSVLPCKPVFRPYSPNYAFPQCIPCKNHKRGWTFFNGVVRYCCFKNKWQQVVLLVVNHAILTRPYGRLWCSREIRRKLGKIHRHHPTVFCNRELKPAWCVGDGFSCAGKCMVVFICGGKLRWLSLGEAIVVGKSVWNITDARSLVFVALCVWG